MSSEEDEDFTEKKVGSDEEGGDEEEPEGEDLPAANDEDDDEEDEEEGQDEYERDNWMVHDDEEEEAEEEQEESAEEKLRKIRKRKKREREKLELDEDDYVLLEENTGAFHRPAPKPGASKFKRLKKAQKAGDKEPGVVRGEDDEEDEGEGRTAEEQLERKLFGGDGAPEDIPEELQEEDEEDEEEGDEEEDEMDDFIVHEEEFDENGQPIWRKKSRKKKGRRPMASGITSHAMQEAHEIFGDVMELLNMHRGHEDRVTREAEDEELRHEEEEDEEGFQRRLQNRALQKQYEPSILEGKYMTDRDERIRATDIPERFQLIEEVTGRPSDSNERIEAEAEWIFAQVFGKLASNPRPEFRRIEQLEQAAMEPGLNKDATDAMRSEAAAIRDEAVKEIAGVLRRMHEHKEEVPFIGMHRKGWCRQLVEPCREDEAPRLQTFEALWAIQRWDHRWALLERRRRLLVAAFKRERSDPEMEEHRKRLEPALVQMVEEAASYASLQDVNGKFSLQFPLEESTPAPGSFKRPTKRSLFAMCRAAGLSGLAEQIGLSAYKLGKNLHHMFKMTEVEDPPRTPEEVAEEYLRPEFSNTQAVLRGARHLAEVEIAMEPEVREHVRSIYADKATVSTRPTPAGADAIDDFHTYAGVKWLKGKPVKEFQDEQWLLIAKAEEEGLLQVTMAVPQQVLEQNIIGEFETAYLSDGVSRSAQLWNEQRRLILGAAIQQRLLPAMETEMRQALASRARDHLADLCWDAMWRRVAMAPYDPPRVREESGSDSAPWLRVLACCWGPGNPATTFVMLDPSGEPMDYLHAGFLSMRANGPEQEAAKRKDIDRLMSFMMDHRPHVVVLGAANLSCRRLKDEIWEVVMTITEKHPRQLAREVQSVQVVYEDETLAQLYENSPVSQEQLPGQPGIYRRAVGLGRYMQNRLAMVAALCGPGREILSAKLHPLQDLLPPDDAYEAIERVLVTVTNQVGVDINLAAAHDWLFTPLQFVCGLGPRKAAHLQRKIRGEAALRRRRDLYDLSWVKLCDFRNCAATMRCCGVAAEDPLDDTRIHPESYDVAMKMALDAYCEDQQVTPEEVEAQHLDTVTEVRERPAMLQGLDMVAYAEEADAGNVDGLYETLLLVKRELMQGYAEWRAPYEMLTQDQEFALLSGESDTSLCEGRLLLAKVVKVSKGAIICSLESGLTGIIDKSDISDDPGVDIHSVGREGAVLNCRVREVQKSKYCVALTCRGRDLREWRSSIRRDMYFMADPSKRDIVPEKAKPKPKETKRTTFKPRMIQHPIFQNLSLPEALEKLEGADVGDAIIRPSSKGPTNLSLTLKFYDGIFTHINIVEEGKDRKDVTSFLRLGQRLHIGDDVYEDLDEVVARYIDPLVGHLREMIAYRKFRSSSKNEIDGLLAQEKQESPARIPYYLSPSYEHPGAFLLSYIRSMSPIHEYITVSAKGFHFRKKEFSSPDKVVKFFQAHFADPLPEPPRRAVAAMVSPRNVSTPSQAAAPYSSWSGPPHAPPAEVAPSRASYGNGNTQAQPIRAGAYAGGGSWEAPPPVWQNPHLQNFGGGMGWGDGSWSAPPLPQQGGGVWGAPRGGGYTSSAPAPPPTGVHGGSQGTPGGSTPTQGVVSTNTGAAYSGWG